MRVNLSSHFRSYTAGAPTVAASGSTLGEALLDLDRQFPGLRFRLVDEQDQVRRHVKVFVDVTPVEALGTPVRASDEIHILGALSGG